MADQVYSTSDIANSPKVYSAGDITTPEGFFHSAYSAGVQPIVDTVKSIAAKGGPAVLNDLVESTIGKLNAYRDNPTPTPHDYLESVPLVGTPSAKIYDQVKEGNLSGALGTLGGTVASFFLPEALGRVPGAARAVADAAPEAGAIAADAVKGGVKGALATPQLSVGPMSFKLPVPAVATGAASGGATAHALGLPSEVGAVIGGAVPIVRGSVDAVRRGIADRVAAQKVADSIAETRARQAAPQPEAVPVAPPPQFAPIPGPLPSGRIPGPAPQVAPPPVDPRIPVWQGIQPTGSAPPMDVAPIAGQLPSGRVPGSIANQVVTPPAPVAPPAPPPLSMKLLDDIATSQLGKKYSRATGPQQQSIINIARKVQPEAPPAAPVTPPVAQPVSPVPHSPDIPQTSPAVVEQPAPPTGPRPGDQAFHVPVGNLTFEEPIVRGQAIAQRTQEGAAPSIQGNRPYASIQQEFSEDTSGVQIPQVVNARSRVAQNIATHLRSAGITSDAIDALEAHPEDFAEFWKTTGQIPGVSKQGTKYSPSTNTIFAARDALAELEKAGDRKIVPDTERPQQLNKAVELLDGANTRKDITATARRLESTFDPRSKYAVRALLNPSDRPAVGQSLGNSWHPAGEVEGYPDDTELNGTAGFHLDSGDDLENAIRKSVKNARSYWPDAERFALIKGSGYGHDPLPEDGGVLLKDATVHSLFSIPARK